MSTLTTIPNIKDVEEYDTEKLFTFLQTKVLNLSEKDLIKFRDQEATGQSFVYMTQNDFTKHPFNFGFEKARYLSVLINRLNSQSK